MSSPLTLRRWEPVEYERDGVVITFEVRRLNALQAAPYRAALARAGAQLIEMQEEIRIARAALPPEPVTPEDQPVAPAADADATEHASYEAALEAYQERHPEYMDALARHVAASAALSQRMRELHARTTELLPAELVERAFRDHVRNVQGVVLDGEAITTGDALFDVADEWIVGKVMGELRRLAEIGLGEGKASASRSTSSPAVPTRDGGSGATSTESEAGPAR